MGKNEYIENLVSQVMRSIMWSTKFWSQAWKDEFASRLASEVQAHLTKRALDAFPLDGKSRCPECTGRYYHAYNCTRQ